MGKVFFQDFRPVTELSCSAWKLLFEMSLQGSFQRQISTTCQWRCCQWRHPPAPLSARSGLHSISAPLLFTNPTAPSWGAAGHPGRVLPGALAPLLPPHSPRPAHWQSPGGLAGPLAAGGRGGRPGRQGGCRSAGAACGGEEEEGEQAEKEVKEAAEEAAEDERPHLLEFWKRRRSLRTSRPLRRSWIL